MRIKDLENERKIVDALDVLVKSLESIIQVEVETNKHVLSRENIIAEVGENNSKWRS